MPVTYSALELQRLCLALIVRDMRAARTIARSVFPLTLELPATTLMVPGNLPRATSLPSDMRAKREATAEQKTQLFLKDGFVDRYSGELLVYPPALHLLSLLLPEEIPYQSNWKPGLCHTMYWSLSATYDHETPIAAGGPEAATNWYTCSMQTNKLKGNRPLADLGWRLHPAGALAAWDGLLHWFVAYLEFHPTCMQVAEPTEMQRLLIASVRRWLVAAKSALRVLD